MTDEPKDSRAGIRRIAQKALAEGRPLEWFEEAYRARAAGEIEIPWSDREPNPILVSLLERTDSKGRRALVAGCGDGQDALWLAGRGYRVTAFDIAPTAVDGCRARHGASGVDWQVANLLAPPERWHGAFDLVVEINTLQSMSPDIRAEARRGMERCVAPGGLLIDIARGREADEPPGAVPWPLTRAEMMPLAEDIALEGEIAELWDDEDPPVRRFVAIARRRG